MKNVMKRRIFLAMVAFSLSTVPVFADLEVGASVQIHAKAEFDAPLAAHGNWVQVGPYGRCWRPARVGLEWRPYCSGEWVWTDCGWYWSADEPWAWLVITMAGGSMIHPSAGYGFRMSCGRQRGCPGESVAAISDGLRSDHRDSESRSIRVLSCSYLSVRPNSAVQSGRVL